MAGEFPIGLFVERPGVARANDAVGVEKRQISGVGGLNVQTLFPGIDAAVDSDDVLVIRGGRAGGWRGFNAWFRPAAPV